jgi:hypothetical protein
VNVSSATAFRARAIRQFAFTAALGTGVYRDVLVIALAMNALNLALPPAGLAFVTLAVL